MSRDAPPPRSRLSRNLPGDTGRVYIQESANRRQRHTAPHQFGAHVWRRSSPICGRCRVRLRRKLPRRSRPFCGDRLRRLPTWPCRVASRPGRPSRREPTVRAGRDRCRTSRTPTPAGLQRRMPDRDRPRHLHRASEAVRATDRPHLRKCEPAGSGRSRSWRRGGRAPRPRGTRQVAGPAARPPRRASAGGG